HGSFLSFNSSPERGGRPHEVRWRGRKSLADPSTTTLRVAVPLPVPGRIDSYEYHADPVGGQSGLLLALDLDGDAIHKLPLAGALLLERNEREPAPDPLAGADGGEEAD